MEWNDFYLASGTLYKIVDSDYKIGLRYEEKDGEWIPTSDLVDLELLELDKVEVDYKKSGKNSYQIGEPSKDLLDVANSIKPKGLSEYTTGNSLVIPFIAADNLVNRGFGKWRPVELYKLASKAVGIPLMLNHDWERIEGIQGVVVSAEVVKFDTPPKWATEKTDNAKLNKKVCKEEGGYYALIMQALVPSDSPLINSIKYGASAISLGGFTFSDIHCPICKTSFYNSACPHLVPTDAVESATDNYAPYYNRVGVTDLGEASLVTIPNLPAAEVIKEKHGL